VGIARAQAPVSVASAAGGTTIAATFGSNVTAGSLLVAFVGVDNLNTPTITVDSTGSPPGWVVKTPFVETSGGNLKFTIAYLPNAPAGATTITATFSVSSGARSIHIVEYSGAATSNVLDQSTAGKETAAVTNPTDDAMVTTAAGDLIVSVLAYRNANAPASVGAGYTLVGNDSAVADLIAEEQNQSSAGSIAPTFTVTGGSLGSGIMSAAFFAAQPGGRPAAAPGRTWKRRFKHRQAPPAAPPAAPTVTTQDLPPQSATPRRWMVPWAKAREAQPPPGALIFTATPTPPPAAPRRRLFPLPRRRVVATQVAITVQPLPQQTSRDRLTPPMARRRVSTQVPLTQVAVTVQALPPQQPVMRRPYWLPRAKPRQAQPPWPQIVVTVTPAPPQPATRRRLFQPRPRARTAPPPTITVQLLPPQQPVRRRLFQPRARARTGQPVPPQVVIVAPVHVAQPRRRWPLRFLFRRKGAVYQPPWIGVAGPTGREITIIADLTATEYSSDLTSSRYGSDISSSRYGGGDVTSSRYGGGDQTSSRYGSDLNEQ
jgi:hypothetical protein